MSLLFDISWLDAPGVDGPDAHTWADVGVSLAGQVLDAADLRDRQVRPRFATTMLPLTEWIIAAWPWLIEERVAAGNDERGAHRWSSHHDLRFGRGGGPMPSVEIRRLSRDHFRLVARDDRERPPGISLSFYRRVDALASAAVVARELARVVEVVLDRLRIADPWLFDDFSTQWAKARSPRALAAGRLGLSAADLAHAVDDEPEILDLLHRDAHLMALCEALSPTPLPARLAAARKVAASLPGVDTLTIESSEWSRVRLATAGDTPWTVGWKAASEFREKAGLSPLAPPATDLPSVLAARFAWPIDRQVVTLPASVRGLDMVTVTATGRMPTAVTWHRSENARRFRLAKSLYYALCTGEAPGIMVDSARMPRHSEANAFAAELLAPVAYLSTRTPADGTWDDEDIERAAAQCAVDPRVVAHQIANRGLGLLAA